jgi:hypothetical protein
MISALLPCFNENPHLTFYAKTNNSSGTTRLNIDNDNNVTNDSIVAFLYATPDLLDINILGTKVTNKLQITKEINGKSYQTGESYETYVFIEELSNINGSFSVVYGLGNIPLPYITQLISGLGNFSFVNGLMVIEQLNENVYKHTVYFTPFCTIENN